MNNLRSYGSIMFSDIPFLKLAIEFPHQEMLREAQAAEHLFVDHRDSEYGTHGWKSLAIHGLGANKTLGFEAYGIAEMEQRGRYGWTEVAKNFPVTTEYFKTEFPANDYARVRFMRLEGGGSIAPHTDYHEQKLASMNLALNNPDGCTFHMDIDGSEAIVPFEPGAAFALNLSYRHWVQNLSKEPRFHMIVHILSSTQEYKEMILKSYQKFLA